MFLLPTCKPPMVHHSFLIEAFNIQFYNCPATSVFPNRLDVLSVQGLSLAHCHISLSRSLAHNRHSVNISRMEEEINGWISAKVFCMWALYHITKVTALLASSTVFISLLTPFSPLLAPLLRPIFSYLCSQSACSRPQSPDAAPGRLPPSPFDFWGPWPGGHWWQMWSHWSVRESQYCCPFLTQRPSRRSQGLVGHWQNKWYLGGLQRIYS